MSDATANIRSGGGGPNLARLVITVPGLLLLSSAVAAALRRVDPDGLAFKIIVAFAALLIVGGGVYAVVRFARLRRPLAAGTLGAAAGIIASVGLPLSLPTTGEGHVGLAINATALAVGCFAVGRVAARRPWCGGCGRWAERRLIALPPDAADSLVAAQRDGSLINELAGLAPIARPLTVSDRRYLAVGLERCDTPRCGSAALSFRDVRFGGGVGQMQQYDLAIGRSPIPRVPLDRHELAQLAGVFGVVEPADDVPDTPRRAGGAVATIENSTAPTPAAPFAGGVCS